MRKKYLSALLFGALLFASAGTFTSCKDYDDDINNLQNQITANADAIKALQELVNNGDYVTKVAKNADGNLVFTFSKSGDQVITLDEEQVGDVLSINAETGELIKNGEPTGWFATKNEEKEQQNCIKVGEDGCWQLLQDDGTYKSTNIPVSGVTAVQNTETKQWTLTIVDAQGNSQQVVIPSAASVMSDLVLAGWIQNTDLSKTMSVDNIVTLEEQSLKPLEVKYRWIESIVKDWDNKETTWSAQKEVKKGQVLNNLAANNTQLITRVAPADLDLSGMSFTLEDSKGNKLPIGLNAAKNFTGTLTRAANSSINTILLDVTSDVYSNKDAYTALYDNSANKLYSLVETSGARSNYGLTNVTISEYTKGLVTPKVTSVNPAGTVVSGGETGDGTLSTKPFIVDLNTPTRLIFNDAGTRDQVYDYYVEVVDEQAGKEFGFSTDKKNGTITLTKSIDLVSKAALELNVYALRIDGTIFKSQIWIKPSSIMASDVTLKAGDEVITPILNADGQIISDKNTQFVVSLDEMFQSMSETDKARWTSSVTGATGNIVISDVNNDYSGSMTASFLKADGKAGNNTNAASLLVTVPFTKDGENPILTPDKEYSALVTFQHKEEDGTQTVLNTVKLTFTPKLPALSSFMTKRDAYWNGNVLMAYFNDPAADATAPLESKFDMSYGFTVLGKQYKDEAKNTFTAMDVDFNLDPTQKIGDDLVGEATNLKIDNNSTALINEITLGTVANGKKPFGYAENLNILVGAKYMKVYDYSQYASTKSQLDDAAFQIKVQSALEAGTIEPAEGTSIVLTPSGAGQAVQIVAKDIIGYAYNHEATYSLFKVLDKASAEGKAVWKYTYIDGVIFESADTKLYTIVQSDGKAVDPEWDADNSKEIASYISLQPVNTTQEVNTSVKVTVTDKYGYVKVVNVPITIKKAATNAE